MFLELKEVKYLKKITDFKSLIMYWRVQVKTEAYLEPKWGFMVEFFYKYT